MIANARMYAVSPEAAGRWRALLTAIVAASGISVDVIEHPAPAPLEDLWRRTDQGAVFMCGLPFSRSVPQPVLMAAPVPSPAEYGGEPRYWSELVVRRDSGYRSVSDTFGGRLALTVPGSQSGCVAALSFFMSAEREPPLFAEVIAPTVTPLGALSAVVRGDADIAPIDSYAFALLGWYRPDLAEQVRIVGRTTPTPIPPLVASQAGLEALQSAFLEAHRIAPMRALMHDLLLQRFARPAAASYLVLEERFVVAALYWARHPLAKVVDPAFVL